MILLRENINSFSLVWILRLSSLLLLSCFAFLRHLTVNRKFFFRILFTPRARQGRRKTIVCPRIPGLKLDRRLKRWNRFRESLG